MICPCKGLLFRPVPGIENKYVHIFCILMNRLWVIKNDEVTYDSDKLKEMLEDPNTDKCIICMGTAPISMLSRCTK